MTILPRVGMLAKRSVYYEIYFQTELNKNTIKTNNIHARLINNRNYVERNIAKRILTIRIKPILLNIINIIPTRQQ